MKFNELGLRPCLIENFPISAKDELETINKVEKEVSQTVNLARRKKRLKAALDKFGLVIEQP